MGELRIPGEESHRFVQLLPGRAVLFQQNQRRDESTAGRLVPRLGLDDALQIGQGLLVSLQMTEQQGSLKSCVGAVGIMLERQAQSVDGRLKLTLLGQSIGGADLGGGLLTAFAEALSGQPSLLLGRLSIAEELQRLGLLQP